MTEKEKKKNKKSSNKTKAKSDNMEEAMEEAYKIEKLLGCRKASSEVGVSDDAMEYLVKWSYYSYRDLEWMLASDFE